MIDDQCDGDGPESPRRLWFNVLPKVTGLQLVIILIHEHNGGFEISWCIKSVTVDTTILSTDCIVQLASPLMRYSCI